MRRIIGVVLFLGLMACPAHKDKPPANYNQETVMMATPIGMDISEEMVLACKWDPKLKAMACVGLAPVLERLKPMLCGDSI